MALSNVTLTNGQWKKISLAGQSGAAWKWNTNSPVSILIAHSDQTQTPTDNIPYGSETGFSRDAAYLLPDKGISDVLESDNGNDIFYATILNTGETAEIVVDFI
jgi:hypothetical protein